MTWTFGRAWDETAPARPGRDRLGGLGRGGEALQRQRGGQRAAEPERRGVPHLDDRRAADVEAHERAAADLVDDGVGEREQDALAGRGGGDRGRAARGRWRPRGRQAVAGEEGAGALGGVEVGLAARASARPPAPTGRAPRRARQRMRGSGDEDQPAAQERRRRRSSPPRPGTGRARCRRAGARAPRRRTAPRRVATSISRSSSRAVKSSSSGPMCSATSGVASTDSRRDSPDSGDRAARLLGQPEDLGRERREPPCRPASARSRGRCARTARRPAPCAARRPRPRPRARSPRARRRPP